MTESEIVKKLKPPCTIRQNDGTQYTADKAEIIDNNVVVYWWTGFNYCEEERLAFNQIENIF